jgi:thiol-disulfide isomerase/thioredoxin
MRRLLLSTVAVALLALAGCTTASNAVDETAGSGNRYVTGDGKTVTYPVGQRKTAPSLTGTTLAGAKFDLASTRGQVVVVNFWASWCAPCRLEASALQATYLATKADGVTFLGVDSRDEQDAGAAFESGRVTYPSLFDPAGRVALDFSDVPPTTLPATLILDRAGKVAAVIRATIQQDTLTTLVHQIAGEKS